jgi:endonuclease YncB( thermonuclease family)
MQYKIAMTRLLAALFLVLASPAMAQTIEGRASVIDGDTIEIHGERIRLNGVDAPESWQRCVADGKEYRCGKDAAFALDEWLAASRPTRCGFVERDRYGRMVGDCFRADGAAVGEWLVRSGWAVDWVRYSGGEFADAQDDARRNGRGIWRGAFEQPCEARAKRAKRKASC